MPQNQKTLFIGQIDIVQSPECLKTTLGSCVGVALYDPNHHVFGLAHIMLPESNGRQLNGEEGKFADTAIPALIRQMNIPLSRAFTLQAKVAGGANMFKTNKEAIGERNIQAVKSILQKLDIKIIGEDLGGDKGRQMTINAETKEISVNKIGEQSKNI